jgi:hypothetical protein
MAGGIEWFRWHHGSVTDPKFQLVARKAGASLPDVLAVWAYLLETASASSDRGSFTAIDCEAWDCLFGFPSTETRTADILKAMQARDLIGDGFIVRWGKRQPKRERPEDDTAADRKRNQRAREAAIAAQTPPPEATSEQVTPCHATSHQKQPRGEKSREEEKDPHTPKGAKSAVSLKAWLESLEAVGVTPIPPDDAVFTYAASVGIPMDFLRLAWLEFRHRYSQPDAKRYRDWRAVFRKAVRGNWLRLWWLDAASQQYGLTTMGMQAKRAHEERVAA